MNEALTEIEAPGDLGAGLMDALKEEAVETVTKALTAEPWNSGFTEEQKSGLVEFHCNMLDFYVWKATCVWREGRDTTDAA